MSSRMYNVLVSAHTAAYTDWQQMARCWEVLNSDVGGSPDFNPLTVKARFVTGVILSSCRSVSILLNGQHLIETTFYPAYAVFTSAIDLLGRCIRGESTEKNNSQNLETGFQWLRTPRAAEYQSVKQSDTLVQTSYYGIKNPPCSIEELCHLRNYSAHGRAINKAIKSNAESGSTNRPANCPAQDFDYLILGEMPPLISKAMESYLTELKTNDDLAGKLATAGVTPYGPRAIFDSMWGFSAEEDEYPVAVGQALREMDWSYKDPLYRIHTSD